MKDYDWQDQYLPEPNDDELPDSPILSCLVWGLIFTVWVGCATYLVWFVVTTLKGIFG